MSVITLNDALSGADGALAGLVCLGWEEVRAYRELAECTNIPIVLMVGPGARASMDIEIWGAMLRNMAERSKGRFVLHLDHGRDLDEVKAALDAGFSSVMYDGSSLTLHENIENTNAMISLAQNYGASTEGEIGFVGYEDGAHSEGTRLDDARAFAQETQVDFMAVSVGNVHLQKAQKAMIRWDELAALAELQVNLVIHGGSGVRHEDRLRMARDYHVRKFNIGTEIRQIFGQSLRDFIHAHPEEFDHLKILQSTHAPILDEAHQLITSLWSLS